MNLSETMSRDSSTYQLGMKTDLTPLLSMQLYGSYHEDRFPFEPIRNGEAKLATAAFNIAADAVVSGIITVSYRDATFTDPGLKPQRGMVGSAAIVYPFLEVGRLGLTASRSVEYSFDVSEGYYVEQSISLSPIRTACSAKWMPRCAAAFPPSTTTPARRSRSIPTPSRRLPGASAII